MFHGPYLPSYPRPKRSYPVGCRWAARRNYLPARCRPWRRRCWNPGPRSPPGWVGHVDSVFSSGNNMVDVFLFNKIEKYAKNMEKIWKNLKKMEKKWKKYGKKSKKSEKIWKKSKKMKNRRCVSFGWKSLVKKAYTSDQTRAMSLPPSPCLDTWGSTTQGSRYASYFPVQ